MTSPAFAMDVKQDVESKGPAISRILNDEERATLSKRLTELQYEQRTQGQQVIVLSGKHERIQLIGSPKGLRGMIIVNDGNPSFRRPKDGLAQITSEIEAIRNLLGIEEYKEPAFKRPNFPGIWPTDEVKVDYPLRMCNWAPDPDINELSPVQPIGANTPNANVESKDIPFAQDFFSSYHTPIERVYRSAPDVDPDRFLSQPYLKVSGSSSGGGSWSETQIKDWDKYAEDFLLSGTL